MRYHACDGFGSPYAVYERESADMNYTDRGQETRINETAKEMGLKPPTIRKKIANREIDIVRFGRAVRIPEEAVRKLIAQNTVPARTR
jgi:excisionase family DNA binding protein